MSHLTAVLLPACEGMTVLPESCLQGSSSKAAVETAAAVEQSTAESSRLPNPGRVNPAQKNFF